MSDDRRMSVDHAPKEINYRYQLSLFGNLFLSCIQAGFAIGSNNLVGQILMAKFNFDPIKETLMYTFLTSAVVAGMTLGSLFSGAVTSCGRWRALILMQCLIMASCGCSLIFNYWVILVSKFF